MKTLMAIAVVMVLAIGFDAAMANAAEAGDPAVSVDETTSLNGKEKNKFVKGHKKGLVKGMKKGLKDGLKQGLKKGLVNGKKK